MVPLPLNDHGRIGKGEFTSSLRLMVALAKHFRTIQPVHAFEAMTKKSNKAINNQRRLTREGGGEREREITCV